MNNTFIPDESQALVINLQRGYHLVLASPGCGKTQILAERVAKAYAMGVPFSNMLCLTFTNRAARGMQERIAMRLEVPADDLFVGNVHRFCSRFLFDAGIVAASTSIIDDDDILSILCNFSGEDESQVGANYRQRGLYMEAMQLSHLMFQIENNHPRDLRLHPSCLSSDDILALKKICLSQHKPFDAAMMVDIYKHIDTYRDVCSGLDAQQLIYRLLRKMQLAHQYERYKDDNRLMDFEDILLLSYEHREQLPRFSWIQVDEVQDLNPLQLALIDAMTAREEEQKPCVIYLGDPQQSIFSFMGAKCSTLDFLRNRCAGNIHSLSKNHRSPKYLLDIFNTYAVKQMGISPDLLPSTSFQPTTMGNELQWFQSDTIETEYLDAAQQAVRMLHDFPEDTTAIIVNSNRDADGVSGGLKQLKAPHFKVSGEDLFSSPQIKLLFAHLTIMNNPHNFIAWARILEGMQVFRTSNAARRFVRACSDRALLPSDFLRDDDQTYISRFVNAYENEVITIFDTETTGLDVFNDDILQIAAVQLKNGAVVPGSAMSIYLESDKEIPEMLGDIVNPIIEERRHHQLISRQEALQRFVDYAQNTVLLGHNADFDIHILTNNLLRELPECPLPENLNNYLDSLLLIRLLRPGLRQYKLKYLLEVLHLEGENSHLADADVNATRSLTAFCYAHAREMVAEQQSFITHKRVQERVVTLRNNYLSHFHHTANRLWTNDDNKDLLVEEMRYLYSVWVEEHLIEALPTVEYIFRYVASDLLQRDEPPALALQIGRHILELNTLKEADLCGSATIDDKIFVTTVHKAKGLEFDNVIIFDVIEGRYPNYYSRENPSQVAEDARKLYVAMTRAKKRLMVMQSSSRIDYRGQRRPIALSRFMECIVDSLSPTHSCTLKGEENGPS